MKGAYSKMSQRVEPSSWCDGTQSLMVAKQRLDVNNHITIVMITFVVITILLRTSPVPGTGFFTSHTYF